MTCCFTGHRPQNLPFKFNENDFRCDKLKYLLRAAVIREIEHGTVHFISGMALGCDTYAAETVLALKEIYQDITLSAYIPCRNQSSKWSNECKARYNKILKFCDEIVVLQEEYTYDCMEKRNRAMVDNSDRVIAVWDHSRGGTGNTVKYAHERGKHITIINPSVHLN